MDRSDGKVIVKIAAVDIGTNTILLLIADVDASRNIRVLSTAEGIARIGKGIHAHGVILQESFRDSERILESLLRQAYDAQVDRIVLAGTSALRDAANRAEYVEAMRRRFGLGISILSGAEEAALTYEGAMSDPNLPDSTNYAVLDIGGGSTELIVGARSEFEKSVSLDIGCVRLTSSHFPSLPPDAEALDRFDAFVSTGIKRFPEVAPDKTLLIGVAGTAYTLALLDNALKGGAHIQDGYSLPFEAVDRMYRMLVLLTAQEIRRFKVIPFGRADVITAGAGILNHVMKKYGFDAIRVSERGLRYGLVLREAFHPSIC